MCQLHQDTKFPKLGHHLDFEPVSIHVATSVWNVGSVVLSENCSSTAYIMVDFLFVSIVKNSINGVIHMHNQTCLVPKILPPPLIGSSTDWNGTCFPMGVGHRNLFLIFFFRSATTNSLLRDWGTPYKLASKTWAQILQNWSPSACSLTLLSLQ